MIIYSRKIIDINGIFGKYINPYYNRSEFLDNAIKSSLDQTYECESHSV